MPRTMSPTLQYEDENHLLVTCCSWRRRSIEQKGSLQLPAELKRTCVNGLLFAQLLLPSLLHKQLHPRLHAYADAVPAAAAAARDTGSAFINSPMMTSDAGSSMLCAYVGCREEGPTTKDICSM